MLPTSFRRLPALVVAGLAPGAASLPLPAQIKPEGRALAFGEMVLDLSDCPGGMLSPAGAMEVFLMGKNDKRLFRRTLKWKPVDLPLAGNYWTGDHGRWLILAEVDPGDYSLWFRVKGVGIERTPDERDLHLTGRTTAAPAEPLYLGRVQIRGNCKAGGVPGSSYDLSFDYGGHEITDTYVAAVNSLRSAAQAQYEKYRVPLDRELLRRASAEAGTEPKH